MGARYFVIGSINVDLVAQVDRFPKGGETLSGNSFGVYPGGKGANQAVALGRLCADVEMAGKLGHDTFAELCRNNFAANDVSTDYVVDESATSTGVALIEVNSDGENKIVIVAGANALVDPAYVEHRLDDFSAADFALLQLEIPPETVEHALRSLSERGVKTILDPAPVPAAGISNELVRYASYITPNTTEAEALTGVSINDLEAARRAGNMLLDRGAGTVIITSGAEGAFIIDSSEARHVGGFTVDAVDTTAAGDAFNAGFAWALGNGHALDYAVRVANAVGALACTSVGAQSAMPTEADVLRLLD